MFGRLLKAFQGHNHAREDLKFPQRRKGNWLKFFLILFLLPILAAVFSSSLIGHLIDSHPTSVHTGWATGVHAAVLAFLLMLLWVPSLVAIMSWKDRTELIWMILRNLFLIALVYFFLPHSLIACFLNFTESVLWGLSWSELLLLLLCLFYFGASIFNVRKTAFRDIQAARAPQERIHANRWIWFDSLNFAFLLIAFLVVELWFLDLHSGGKFIPRRSESLTQGAQTALYQWLGGEGPPAGFTPLWSGVEVHLRPRPLTEPGATPPTAVSCLPQETDSSRTVWFCSAGLLALMLFMSAGVPNRLMNVILIPASFHERDIKGFVSNGIRYAWHFWLAVISKYPFLFPGGVAATLIYLGFPLLLWSTGNKGMIETLINADEVILALAVSFAWFSPVAMAAMKPEATFGEYFNTRLFDQLMMVQGHLVFFGFGSLGQRVLDRAVGRQLEEAPERYFKEVVTPDLRLEKLAVQAVMIERESHEVIYSGTHPLLNIYGVVSACRQPYTTLDPQKRRVKDETRVLVPVIVGEAREPFVSSRVNLERARMIISTVPDSESVQTIFDRACKTQVSSIISISRSDQISYLTYRARHRRIVLVYPKHNQGNTQGYRLWSAMLKVRALDHMSGDQWPRVLIVGNSKANHYMLETLWPLLPGSIAEKKRLIESSIAVITSQVTGTPAGPALVENPDESPFDRLWPTTLITSGRLPMPAASAQDDPSVRIPTRVINEADAQAISACLEKHRPDILLVSHDEAEASAQILMRCMRAVERLKTLHGSQFRLPMLLLSAARGNERERQVLGDASRYYDALIRLYDEVRAMDLGYPAPARYNHFTRELAGESITDSLLDAEEIISGALRSFSSPEKPSRKKPRRSIDFPHGEKQFIEISSCLPNRPGALANYVASLAGLRFNPAKEEKLAAFWKTEQQDKVTPHLPSFQYLRNLMLNDPEEMGFCLTGYAALVPASASIPALQEQPPGTAHSVRIFANDGRNYVERQIDPLEKHDTQEQWQIKRQLQKIPEPPPPGVPAVIDRLTGRDPNKSNDRDEFIRVLLDPQKDGRDGPCACPGMNNCRVAAFQDYVAGSNNLRLNRVNSAVEGPNTARLHHAQNYFCSSKPQPPGPEELPTPDSPTARVFCCAHCENRAGMIAMVLNTLFFRSFAARQQPSKKVDRDWVINIDYFKDIACQNAHFRVNRLFGFFENLPKPGIKEAPELPLHVVRILPIGGAESACLWFHYSFALFQFLQKTVGPHNLFRFYWFDGNRDKYDHRKKWPQFTEGDPRELPVLMVIKRKMIADQPEEGMCKLCGLQPVNHDCSRFRAWI